MAASTTEAAVGFVPARQAQRWAQGVALAAPQIGDHVIS